MNSINQNKLLDFHFLFTMDKRIYNIFVLVGLLFSDRQEMIERVKAHYYAEMGE